MPARKKDDQLTNVICIKATTKTAQGIIGITRISIGIPNTRFQKIGASDGVSTALDAALAQVTRKAPLESKISTITQIPLLQLLNPYPGLQQTNVRILSWWLFAHPHYLFAAGQPNPSS